MEYQISISFFPYFVPTYIPTEKPIISEMIAIIILRSGYENHRNTIGASVKRDK